MVKCLLLAVSLLLHTPRSHCLSSSTSSTTRYRARVAYDGSGYQGFQLQGPDERTVQLVLEAALCQRLNQEKVRVVAAGRTDGGVHARGQAIHFDLPILMDNEDLQQVEYAVNKMLKKDVCIYNLQVAPPPFVKEIDGAEREVLWNVMYDSIGKLYSYRLSLANVMEPLERRHRWHPDCTTPICPKELSRVAQHFVGTHNFRAFAGSVERLEKLIQSSLNTVRTVHSVTVVEEDKKNGNYRIDFQLDGALYKQVRNMVGALIDVCSGKMEEEQLVRLIQNDGSLMRKDNLSKPAPPEGLTLEKVYFEDEDF